MTICVIVFFTSIAFGQCPTCGNGTLDVGETNLNCPQDIAHNATCTSPCAQPAPFESVAGIRTPYDFTGTTTYSSAGLPVGWTFASGPTATTAGTLAAAGTDAYGAKAGLVQPNCSGSCTGTNGFCIGNIANNVVVGGSGAGGKLGANFDGRANINQNLSYAVLRGQGNPTLVSPTVNMSGVESFKIQFWLCASETSCGQSNGWGSCVGNTSFLDFSADGGTTWTQVMNMNTSATSTDMATNFSTNTFWIQEGTWSRVCLTVFRTSGATGNFYPSATGTTAPSGIMVNSAYFTANFKFRIRYVQSVSCTAGITATNPGRYLAIDYPVITSGNQCIPCGLSFINTCGYGADANDDGVGASGTTNTTVFGTTRRSVNNAEKGVEIFHSQTPTYASQNLTGSNFATNYDLCNSEGGDKQCIDWEANNNFYTAIYEVLSDVELSTVNLQFYKGTTPQSTAMSKVTAAGKTPTIGWRYSANRIVSCGSTSDLNPGCNGYSFVTASLPTQLIRSFYALNTNSLGQAQSYYGPSSSTHYFNGPFFAPIARPDTITGSGNYIVCNGTDPVFTGLVDYCFDNSGFSGTSTISVTGPNGFSETFTSGGSGATPVVDAGDYTITVSTPNSPSQCMNCSRSTCVTLSAIDLAVCSGSLAVNLQSFDAKYEDRKVKLGWVTSWEENNDYFILERSVDGVDFSQIANIESSNLPTETHQYDWVDDQFTEGIVNYYRLSQVDLDGEKTTLSVTAVDCNSNAEFLILSLGNTQYQISSNNSSFSNAEFTIYNAMGTKLFSGQLDDGEAMFTSEKLNGLVYVSMTGKNASMSRSIFVK